MRDSAALRTQRGRTLKIAVPCMKHAILLLLGGLCLLNAQAQQEPDTDIFNGQWMVSIQAASGKARTARLHLVNFSGTWISTSPLGDASTKACLAKKVPVTVQVSQAQTLEFTAWAAQVSRACPDVNITVHPVSEKLLQGTLATGETVTLKRP